MGEATYYAKIFFNSTEETEKALPGVKSFLYQGVAAHEYWQEHRGEKNPEVFWKQFEDKFPLVSEYLRDAGFFGKDCNNGLAGKLDFGSNEEVDRIEVGGDFEIAFAMNVWHFAEWDYIVNFLEKKFPCQMKWLSDEYLDPMEMLTR